MPVRPPARKKRPEEILEAEVIRIAEMLGCEVFTFSQGARGAWDPAAVRKDGSDKLGKFIVSRGGTRQTPGPTDLEIWAPLGKSGEWQCYDCGSESRPLTLIKFEVKTPDGLKQLHRLRQLPLQLVAPSVVKDWKRAQAQARYAALCTVSGQLYGVGGVPELLAIFRGLGLVKDGQQGGDAPLLVRGPRHAFQRVDQIARGPSLTFAPVQDGVRAAHDDTEGEQLPGPRAQ